LYLVERLLRTDEVEGLRHEENDSDNARDHGFAHGGIAADEELGQDAAERYHAKGHDPHDGTKTIE
jgi:hypothetical protein